MLRAKWRTGKPTFSASLRKKYTLNEIDELTVPFTINLITVRV